MRTAYDRTIEQNGDALRVRVEGELVVIYHNGQQVASRMIYSDDPAVRPSVSLSEVQR